MSSVHCHMSSHSVIVIDEAFPDQTLFHLPFVPQVGHRLVLECHAPSAKFSSKHDDVVKFLLAHSGQPYVVNHVETLVREFFQGCGPSYQTVAYVKRA